MKRFILLASCFLVVGFSSIWQNKLKSTKATPVVKNQVRQYWFVMLTKGQNRTQDSATAANIQDGHMATLKNYTTMAN